MRLIPFIFVVLMAYGSDLKGETQLDFSTLGIAQATEEGSEGWEFGYLNGEDVQIRGFLVKRAMDSQWVVAAEPGKHSCCHNAAKAIPRQIVLDRAFSPDQENTVAEVKGTLRLDPQRTPEGKLTQVYRLENTREAAEHEESRGRRTPFVRLAEICLVALVVGFTFWRKANR